MLKARLPVAQWLWLSPVLQAKQLSDPSAVFLSTFFPSGPGKKDKLILIGTPLADTLMAATKPTDVKPPADDVKPLEEILQEQTVM